MEWISLPVKDWMSVCLPGTNPDSVFRPFDVNLHEGVTAMYPGLCNGMNDILANIGCTKFLAYSTSGIFNAPKLGSLDDEDTLPPKMELSILPRKHVELCLLHTSAHQPKRGNATMSLDENMSPSAPVEATDPYDREPRADHTTLAEVLVDVKLDPEDPFPEHTFLSHNAKYARQSRDQLALCTSELFRVQHRTHAFLISICGQRARLVRFDRSGMTVSEGIDYTTQDGVEVIGLFLYRLFRPSATPEERGADPTATLATDEEAKFFSSLYKTFQTDSKSPSRIGEHLKNAAADGTWPIYVLDIISRWSQSQVVNGKKNLLPVRQDSPIETHRCLVGKPMFTGRSVEGRGTKCFVGWDIDGDRPVMIKDSWRADLYGIGSELDTYMTLWEGVTDIKNMYIPTPLGGGDVYHVTKDGSKQYQRTLDITALPVLPHTAEPPTRLPRIHTRLALKEICEPLKDFTDAEQLVGVTFHALLAHYHAWTNHKILHRDISIHNILIYYPEHMDNPKGTVMGLLSNWDLARTECQLDQGPILLWRSGTWQSMSALLQFLRVKRYEVSDDLESFMHVLNWCALRFLPNEHSGDPAALGTTMFHLFDRHVNRILEDGAIGPGGALLKLNHVRKGKPFAPVDPPDHPFSDLLKKLAVLCQQHYATYDIDQIIANSRGPEGKDESTRPQSTKPEPSSTKQYYVTSVNSQMLLEWLVTSLGEPSTPTRASSVLVTGSIVNETTQHRETIILDSPPRDSQTREIKDHSESPLLDHKQFVQAIADTLRCADVRWDLLPKRINALDPPAMIVEAESDWNWRSTPPKLSSSGVGRDPAMTTTPAPRGRKSDSLLRKVLLKHFVDQQRWRSFLG